MQEQDKFIEENADQILETNRRLAVSLANSLLARCATYREAVHLTYKMSQTYPTTQFGPESHLNQIPACIAEMAGDLIRQKAQSQVIPTDVKKEGVKLDD